MTIGIYSLYWEKQDLIYIGQSVNVERRKSQHLNNLKLGKHSNYKVQLAFKNYGVPIHCILQECKVQDLTRLEYQWVLEFNALSVKGLCLINPLDREGVYSPGSKYPKILILLIFRALYLTSDYLVDIANRYSVPEHLVEQIKSGASHTWLQEEHPTQYNKMLQISRRSTGDRGKYENNPLLISSPDNTIFKVTNCKKFAREHNLDPTALSKVCRGIRSQHKGWYKPT